MIRELAKVGTRKRVLVRRISRSCSRSSDNEQIIGQPTSEELAFAKLMAVLCISFVICWMPQMVNFHCMSNESIFLNVNLLADFDTDGSVGLEIQGQQGVLPSG